MNPAVRLVRVAVALCDRFGELLKGPSQVTARKQQGALVGFGGNQDDLSMRIGEAQQIYPEIWRHLDDARTAFAATGIEVAAYDALRAAEGQGQGAAVDIIQTKEGFGQHAIHEHVKHANFNHAGLARARKACDALMLATPQIDWAGLAKSEANDPEAAAFGRSLRRKRLIQFGVLGLLIAAPFLIVMYLRHAERIKADERRQAYDAPITPAVPLTEAERTELTATVAQLRSSIATARKNWAATTTPDALKSIAPGTRPCPVPVNGPAEPAADAYIRSGGVDPEAFASSAFLAYLAVQQQQTLPDTDLLRAENQVLAVDRRLAAGTAAAWDRAALAELELYSTVVIIDKDVEAEVTQTTPMTYTPGEVSARGYVFSIRDGRFVCAATITARTTPSEQSPKFLDGVRTAPDATAMLHRELEIRIRQALAANLRSIDPRQP